MSKVLILIILVILADRSLANETFKCSVTRGETSSETVPGTSFKYNEINSFRIEREATKADLFAQDGKDDKKIGKGKFTVGTDGYVSFMEDRKINLTLNRISNANAIYEGTLYLNDNYAYELRCIKKKD